MEKTLMLGGSVHKKPNDLEWDTAHWGYLNMPGAIAERIE